MRTVLSAEIDHAADLEHDDSRARLLDGLDKRAGPVAARVVTRRYFAAPAAGSRGGSAHGARKCEWRLGSRGAICENNKTATKKQRLDMQCPLETIENDTGFPI